MQKLLFFALIVLINFGYAQSKSGSLVMIRCDNGKNGFLKTPEDIDLTPVQRSFNIQKDTIVLIHGYMNTFSSAQSKFKLTHTILHKRLGDINYIGFYWPVNFIVNFGKGVEHANISGRYLSHVLERLTGFYGKSPGKIHLLSHSLGGRVLLSTLKANTARYIKWGKCSLFAPAVHNNVLFTEFKAVKSIVSKGWVYYSHNDGVLKYLYALWYWIAGQDSPEAQKFHSLPLPQKLDYMRKVEQSDGEFKSEFKAQLYQRIKKSEKDAMGLVGADLGSPKSIHNIQNLNVSKVVKGHAYWGNSAVANMVADKILEKK